MSCGHLQDGGNGARVVRGELREDDVGRIEQRARARQIAHVGVVLVGEHRVGGQTELLGALDLGVPVGALDQTAHAFDAVLARQRGHVFDELDRAGLVGLQRQAQTGPLRTVLRHALRQRLEHPQGKLQPVHLFGVDGQVQVGSRGGFAQGPHARHQFAHDTIHLRVLKTRVQRAEFDGNAVVLRR